jgi:hypothetical protein
MSPPAHSQRTIMALTLALISGCGAPMPFDDSGESESESESGSDSGWNGDCSNLPAPEITQLAGPIASADVAFDSEGYLVGSNTQDLFKASSTTEMPALWVPGVPNRSALRVLSDGRIAVVQEMYRRVLVFAADGSSGLLASNLDYPFGLVEGLDGAVYIGDNSSIVRVDPESGDPQTWLETPDFVSRWMSFDRDYDGMFVGGRTNTIHRVPIAASGEAGVPVVWGTLPIPVSDDTLVDGLGVDACGNVYVAEFYSKGLYRIPVGGGEGEQLVEWSEIEYGHGLQWGSGLGDWSETALFLPQPYNDFNVVEVEVGVPSRPQPKATSG